jgi:hypothetical protein
LWPRQLGYDVARNVVCTSQPLAAQAGLAMLAEGGSAVDAALAAAITLTLVEPVSNGIGSDAFAIVWDGRRLHGLNASGARQILGGLLGRLGGVYVVVDRPPLELGDRQHESHPPTTGLLWHLLCHNHSRTPMQMCRAEISV